MTCPNNSHKLEIISLWYHNDLSILDISRKFVRMFTMKQIATIIIESRIGIENEYLIIESTLNYTNRL